MKAIKLAALLIALLHIGLLARAVPDDILGSRVKEMEKRFLWVS